MFIFFIVVVKLLVLTIILQEKDAFHRVLNSVDLYTYLIKSLVGQLCLDNPCTTHALPIQMESSRCSSQSSIMPTSTSNLRRGSSFIRRLQRGFGALWYGPDDIYPPLDVCKFYSGLGKDSLSKIISFRVSPLLKRPLGRPWVFYYSTPTPIVVEGSVTDLYPIVTSGAIVRLNGNVVITSLY